MGLAEDLAVITQEHYHNHAQSFTIPSRQKLEKAASIGRREMNIIHEIPWITFGCNSSEQAFQFFKSIHGEGIDNLPFLMEEHHYNHSLFRIYVKWA